MITIRSSRFPIVWLLSFAILFISGKCLIFVNKEKYDKSLQAETDNGIVQGFRRKMESQNYAFVYRGIPFAKPPLYDLRFTSPQQHPAWSGVLNATSESPSCVEFILRLSGIKVTGSEDCLYLNVYSPIEPHSNKLVPVIFWIYGGSFLEGNITLYDPEYLVEEQLVVVTPNYRLGMFGFLSTEDEAAQGNYGLKDQNAALKWVQRNIKNFGGNPDRVTIMGHSAGACSAMYHLVSPKSRGMFHGVIAMSGGNLNPWSLQKYPKKVAMDVSLHLGLQDLFSKNTTDFVNALRKMDSHSLMYGQILPVLVNFVQTHQNGLVFTPVVESNHKDAFITESNYKLLEEGKFPKVPLIMGVTTMEFKLFFTALALIRPLLLTLDLSPSMIPTGMNISSQAQRRIVGNKVRRKYFQSQSCSTATDDELLHYFSDVFFIKPMQKSLQLITKYMPVFAYIFDYQSESAIRTLEVFDYHLDGSIKGVGHAEDMAYIWKSPYLNENDKRVRRNYVKLLSNFAKYGNPTPKTDELLDNVIWYPVTAANSSYLLIGKNLTILQSYRRNYMKFWEGLCDKYCQKPLYTY